MAIELRKSASLVGLLLVVLSSPATAAPATSEDAALKAAQKLTPIQKDVDCDRVTEQCTCKVEKTNGKTGWIVRDPAGQIVRHFLDTNGDNTVDQWSYYKDGIEVYRDIDANFNTKPDQYRWLNTAGTRWAIDKDEDGRIDLWKAISAEEATAEVVAALRDRDPARFERLLLTPAELKSLGVGPARSGDIAKKIKAAPAAFKELMAKQKTVTPETKWVYFGGTKPGIVPAGTAESTADLLVYENVAAMVETGGKHAQVPIGALVKVDDTWRVVDAPRFSDNPADPEVASGVFIQLPIAKNEDRQTEAGGPSKKAQELMAKLEEIDKSPADLPEEQAKQNARRADILEELAGAAESAQERSQWIRQFADTVNAASQAGNYPDGASRLKTMADSLKQKSDAELAAYVQFRYMTADNNQKLQQPGADFAKIQAQWMEDLEAFVNGSPKTADAADAMLQLGIAYEFAGEETKALKWYDEIVKNYKTSTAFAKADGAKTRLESVGKSIRLKGKKFGGGSIELASRDYRDKVVLIQFWASGFDACKRDLPQLKDVLDRYGKNGFAIIGVSLDSTPKALEEYLQDNPLPWPQIYEPGGLDSRLANELGILTLPTMILVDKEGKVLNRDAHASDLEAELKTLLKPRVANKPGAK